MLIQKQVNFVENTKNNAAIFFIILIFSILKIFQKKQLWYYEYRMTKYNILNVKLSNPQSNKLKSGIKNGTEVPFHQI